MARRQTGLSIRLTMLWPQFHNFSDEDATADRHFPQDGNAAGA